MDYIPVLFMMTAGVVVSGAVMVLTHILGPKLPSRMKNEPFECGVPPLGDSKRRISVRFYLVAILFLLFDVEGIFFIPWAIVFKKFLAINHFILFEMGVFLIILLVGFIYVLKKGALEWD